MVCTTNHGPDCHHTFLAFALAMSFIKLKGGLKLASEWWYAVCKNRHWSMLHGKIAVIWLDWMLMLMEFCLSGWTACILLLIALIFSKSLITLTTNAIFSTIIHMTWSIIILWIIIASISKHRGTKTWFDFEYSIQNINFKISTALIHSNVYVLIAIVIVFIRIHWTHADIKVSTAIQQNC